MDSAPVILGILKIIFGVLVLVVIPGFALSLVIFPRLSDMSILDRLVYITVLGITSALAFVVFLDLMPGLVLTPENLLLAAVVFSAVILMVWQGERWYLARHQKTHPGPKVPEDSPDHQRYYSREINAAKDQFRQDTRTVVVYHESERVSGMNFVSHSYLLDVGEEIDIQQVAENKLKGTDSHILEPPYPKTRYFELIILEHNEGSSSMVDDLQIYPVHVTTKPDTTPGTTLQRDSLLITEKISAKSSTEEVQWVYSHDFHIFAFIHADDTLTQMVDRVLGTLDEIVIAVQSGVRIASSERDRQTLRAPFDAVSKEPQGTVVETPEPPHPPGEQPGVQSGVKTRRPVILPGGQDEEIYGDQGGEILVGPLAGSRRPVIQTRDEPIPGHTDFQSGVVSRDIADHPEIQTRTGQDAIKNIPDKQPGIPVDRPEPPLRQTVVAPKTIPARQEAQPRPLSKKHLSPMENKIEVASIRKLQKNILRDLNMYDLTPDSFRKSQKIIDKIQIPKKADVNKKLSEAEEEMLDLNWLYE